MSAITMLNDLFFSYTNTSDAEERSQLEKEIWDRYGVTGAVCVWDMAGFSQTSFERGIVYYLAMVRRMQIIVSPIIEQFGGKVVKFEADNCFACFPSVEAALDAALGITIAVEAANRTTPKDLDIEFSCGIDHGEFLLIGDDEFFGLPVIRASKLGEDIGTSGDLLVTRNAMQRLEDPSRFPFEEMSYTISGITIEACRMLS